MTFRPTNPASSSTSLAGNSARPLPRILAVTNMYPTAEDPTYGTFVATQMASVAGLGAVVHIHFVDGRRSILKYVAAIPEVRRLARSGAYDLVHAHYGLSGFVASFQPLPLLISFCGDDLLGTPDGHGSTTWKSKLIRRMSRYAARRADAIICKSEELRLSLPRTVERRRAHVIGNGVDTQHFKPGDRGAARKQLGIDLSELLILFPHSRRQWAVKRFDLAEAAVRSLGAQGMKTRLWVVNGVSPAAMPVYYQAADCLLLTSDHEGSPNVVKEALCCDLPVVSVDAGDVRRWFSLTKGCYMVDRDPRAIADGLRTVLTRGVRVDGTRVRSELGLDTVSRLVMSVYREAVAGRGTSIVGDAMRQDRSDS